MSWGAYLKSVFRREHKLAPKVWVTSIVAAIYVLSPWDILPELLLVPLFGPLGLAGGLADDLAVIGVAFGLLLKDKKRWEAEQIDGSTRSKSGAPDDTDIIDVDSY